ncbi:uncharacterized protein LOC110610181 isoform X2 [Manihot esculenta]|uniref:uncharacterized protein LOC110610181 isoform X2 n=1 Tax=Manihot esculenta TaxID=3983 RepID=UPI001CC67381|nr:uncharacterized protein LOC110610181 isoform X2 [Manihot esculenta]
MKAIISPCCVKKIFCLFFQVPNTLSTQRRKRGRRLVRRKKMVVSVNNPSCSWNLNLKKLPRENHLSRWSSTSSWLNVKKSGGLMRFDIINRQPSTVQVKASCLFNPTDQPIVKEALKEPVAFLGGMFAGFLRLDLDDEPLKEWVTRTVDASGIAIEDTDGEGSKPEEIPQQIEIE